MIEIGVVGRITEGEEVGRFVFVEELPDNPPSYLIHTAADRDFKISGGDSWVEDFSSLVEFFKEGRWTVEWLR
ncbi:hypothetical protein ACOALZ_00535 [Nocardiopsis algeriensis]|uniref:hypothetical protein n=1 Tax=Nocardiopsis algeriensis TaxID=1478215 RepID=UPI003B427BE6